MFKINDKVLHATTFMILFFLMEGAHGNLKRAVMSAYLMAYGASIETIQFFLPYREFSLLDIAANATGLCAYYLIRRSYASTLAEKITAPR